MARTMLQQVRIAAPCPARWEGMEGDDRARYCSECKLNVYNISDMTKAEAEDFLRRAEGRTCIRMYQRADGTVLTKNCPVGLRAIYRRTCYAACLAIVMTIGAFSTAMATLRGQSRDSEPLVEQARDWPVIGAVINHFAPQTSMGAVAVMGKMPVGPPPVGTGSGKP